jgi:hypothetical protein
MKKKQVKEKMYDFGELGKWSEGTLRANMVKKVPMGAECSYHFFYRVSLIESVYSKRMVRLHNDFHKGETDKIKNMTVGQLMNTINSKKTISKLQKDLDRDYGAYCQVMNKMVGRETT